MVHDADGRPQDLDWLLNDFAQRVPEIVHILAVSGDGLVVAASDGLDEEEADQLAAVASGLVALLVGGARLLKAAPVRSNLTELAGGFMFSMAVSDGASLLVFATRACDIGQVSFEMSELINAVGTTLTPSARARMLTDNTAGRAR